MNLCLECAGAATVGQGDVARCPDHATDRAALHARLHALESATLPDDPGERDGLLAEADLIEFGIGELEAG